MSRKVDIIREALSRNNDPELGERYEEIIRDLESEWKVTSEKRSKASLMVQSLIDELVTKHAIPPRVVMDIFSKAIDDELGFIEETEGWLSDSMGNRHV